MRKKIFMFYGYFLKGTGSAIYARELVRALNRTGIDVVLFSQEETPEELDFIEESYEISLSTFAIKKRFLRNTGYAGKTIHYRHDLKGFLPVYVYDSYPGYRKVKTFSSMTRREMDFYRSCVQQSVKLVMDKHNIVPNGVLYHHLSPLPSILFEFFETYGIKQIAIYHGSDINFAIKQNKFLEEDFRKIAKKLDAIITLAESGKAEVEGYLGRDFSPVIKVVPPGLDFSIFYPRKNKQEALYEFLQKFKQLVQDKDMLQKRNELIEKIKKVDNHQELFELFKEVEKTEALKLTEPDTCKILESSIEKPLILFAGKYLWTKGVASLLFAMPYIWKKHDNAVLFLVGFGASRGILEKIVDFLGKEMVAEAAELTLKHVELDPGSKEELIFDAPLDFAKKLKDGFYLNSYKKLSDLRKFKTQVYFLGYLDHERLAPVLSASDVFVAPSIFKESFGMVLIEAIACGTLAVASCHSGFGDTIEIFSRDFGISKDTLCVELNDCFTENLANAINAVLGERIANQPSKIQMHNWAFRNYSWDAAAREIAFLLNH